MERGKRQRCGVSTPWVLHTPLEKLVHGTHLAYKLASPCLIEQSPPANCSLEKISLWTLISIIFEVMC